MKRTALGLTFLLATLATPASTGVGEVSLDRAAVQSLLEAALSEPVEVNVRGLGPVSVRFGKPRALDFIDGGIESELSCTLEQLGLTLDLHVRFVPVLDRELGEFHIAAESVVPAVPVPVTINFATLVPKTPIPRRFAGKTTLPNGAVVDVEMFAQGVSVGEGRFVVEFGLKVR